MNEKRRYNMTARAVKADATKARIRAAAVELYVHGAIEDFTLETVADRAETTVQTVLRAFGSKDELIYAMLEAMAAGGTFLKLATPGDVRGAVAAHFDIYEGIGDFIVHRLGEERRRPALKASLEKGRTNHREGVKAMFAPQLQRLSGAARAQLLTSLMVLTDVYVWKLLRRDMALSRPASEAIVSKMILSVTDREKDDGTHPVAELVRRRQPAA
jgi:AcrR family transcriptional regulator